MLGLTMLELVVTTIALVTGFAVVVDAVVVVETVVVVVLDEVGTVGCVVENEMPVVTWA